MKRSIIAVLSAMLVFALAPAAWAAAPTDVESNHSVIYPFVGGGRADVATISWFADGAVDIYVNGDFAAMRGSDVSEWDYNGFAHTPNPGVPTSPGANTNTLGDFDAGATSTDAIICVVERDSFFDYPGDVEGDCTTVTVRRVYEVIATHQRHTKIGMHGARYAKIRNSNCELKTLRRSLKADCRTGRARVFYRTGLPFIGPGEFIADAWQTVKYWDGGDGFHVDALVREDSRVRVKLQRGFLGQVRRVRVDFDIDANDTIIIH